MMHSIILFNQRQKLSLQLSRTSEIDRRLFFFVLALRIRAPLSQQYGDAVVLIVASQMKWRVAFAVRYIDSYAFAG